MRDAMRRGEKISRAGTDRLKSCRVATKKGPESGRKRREHWMRDTIFSRGCRGRKKLYRITGYERERWGDFVKRKRQELSDTYVDSPIGPQNSELEVHGCWKVKLDLV